MFSMLLKYRFKDRNICPSSLATDSKFALLLCTFLYVRGTDENVKNTDLNPTSLKNVDRNPTVDKNANPHLS